MKVNSEIRNLKRNIIVNVEKVSNEPDVGLIIDSWRELIISMQDILERGNVNLCYQEIYQKINDLLMFEIPASVSLTIEEMFSTHAKNTFKILKDLAIVQENSNFFEAFNSIWKNISKNFSLLRKILIKFEKIYFSNRFNINSHDDRVKYNSTWGFYMDNLKNILQKDSQFLEILIKKILDKINIYRDSLYSSCGNESLSFNEINEAISFLWEADLYKGLFHENFMKLSLNYYSDLASKIINAKPIEEYIGFVEKSLEVENNLIISYLNEFSLKKIIQQLEVKLILENKSEILKNIFNSISNQKSITFLNEDHLSIIKKVYIFFKKLKIEDDLKKCWLSFVQITSGKIFKDFDRNYTIVDFFENLIKLKKNIDITILQGYLSDEKFKSAAKEAFVKSLNLKPNTVADYLSRYIDHILKMSDTEEKLIMNKIDEFIIIFKNIDAKDMFESFFIKRLANRLLYNLTSTTNGERYLIEKLRTECGNVFVTKSEEMLSDIKLSTDLTLNSTMSFSNIQFNFYVLSTNSWPVSKIVQGHINDEISQIQKEFISVNKAKFAGKALKWHYPYCSGELSYKFNNKNVTIEANGVQIAILAKFTKARSEISFEDLVKLTMIESLDLLTCLNSLVKNFQILTYDKVKDTYKLNNSFIPTKTHLIINDQVNSQETSQEEIREVEERNWEDRKHVLDALIMKTLKLKKQMKIQDIIQNVSELVKFPCEISALNERIKSLATGGYLVKDDKDPELIKYS